MRVVDELGREVPYALDPQRAASDSRSVALIDGGFTSHRGTQAVVDLGPGGALIDTLTLNVDVDRVPTYFERIAVDASDDRATWRNVRDDAVIYRVAQDDGRGNQRISIPPTRSRWLRVRVLDAHAPLPLSDATVARSPQQAELVSLALKPRSRVDVRTHRQTWTFVAPVPIRAAAVTFERARGTFSRAVHVETSSDGNAWTANDDDTLARFADGSEHISFAFPETSARYVRIVVENGDDAPLADVMPILFARPREIVFTASHEHNYRLLSSNATARAPAYDLADRLAHARWSAVIASVGPTSANSAYRDPRPPGERFPWLLSSAAVTIALLLGALSVRTIRNAS